MSNTQGMMPQWQQSDLSSGPAVRTNYFQNPTTNLLTTIANATTTLYNSANSAGDLITSATAESLILEIANFQSHTDNISGVAVVSNTYFPSLQSAGNMGQLNMMTLSRSDGVSNTAPILGAFTSLFIQDELQANANTILIYSQQYANSLNYNSTSGTFTSNLSNSQITIIESYVSNTQVLLSSRRNNDWNFYQNSVQLSKDVGFMSQFNNMGGTMTYLVNNLVGTPRLLSNLNSGS
jgi:hypothetical protein